MKKSYYLLLSIGIFMLLFYKQSVGVNLFIFNVLLLGMAFWKMPHKLKDKNVLIMTAGALISSAAAAWYADWSSIVLNILTLTVFPVFLHQEKSTILFAEFFGGLNSISALPRMLLERRGETEEKSQNMLLKKILLFVVLPFVVLVLFFYLYRFINPVWGDYMWRMIGYIFSWSFVLLLLLAVVLMYAFWYLMKFSDFRKFVNGQRNVIAPTEKQTFGSVPLKMEMWSGVLLFGLLNLLLFSLLATDFQQLIIENKIPEGYTLSEYLHKGVYAVIASIVFAIGLIVFYFKGAFNFYKDAKILRIFTWIWIFFNTVLVLFTFYKNILYVQAYDLTFLRISVFIYLILCLVGLGYASVKLWKNKTFAYLGRKMYWALYIMWVLTTPMNWTAWITTYNLNHAKERNYKHENTDIYYLTGNHNSLNNQNVLRLNEFLKENPKNPYAREIKESIDNKYVEILQSERHRKWRGERLFDLCVLKKMKAENYVPSTAGVRDGEYYEELATVEQLTFYRHWKDEDGKKSLDALLKYDKIKHLELIGDIPALKSLAQLEPMKSLKTLSLEGGKELSDNLKIEGLAQLDTLQVSTPQRSLHFLMPYPNLEKIAIDGYNLRELEGLENIVSVKNLTLTTSSLKQIDLGIFSKLQCLSLNSHDLQVVLSKNIPQLEEIEIWGENATILETLAILTGVKTLHIKSASLTSLEKIEHWQQLEELNIANNNIVSIETISQWTDLKKLDLSDNSIQDIQPLAALQQLEELNLYNNALSKIEDYKVVYELPNLKKLFVEQRIANQLNLSKLPKGIDISVLEKEEEDIKAREAATRF